MYSFLETLRNALAPVRLWSALPVGLALGSAPFLLALLVAHHWQRIRYFVRISFYYVVVSVVSLLCCLPSLATPRRPGNLLHVWRVFRGRSGSLFGIDFQVLHPERLRSLGNCILVANHQNSLDIIGIVCHWRLFHPCVPVMKRWFLFSGPVGLICWLSGSVFVDRSNGQRGRQALNAKLRDVSEGRLSLFVFPEGTRNEEPQLLPFKKGAFYMALQCQVPIVPVVFSRYSSFFSVKKKIYNNGRVTMTILPPVFTHGMSVDRVSEITSRVQALMQEHIDWELANDGQIPDLENGDQGCSKQKPDPSSSCPVRRCSPVKSRTLV